MRGASLVVDGVSKHFGGVRAVDKCSFTVPAGTVVGLIGPNGAGKSTVFNLLSGLTTPDSGRVLLDGDSIIGLPPQEIAGRGVGRTFQTPRFFPKLDVLENMLASAGSDGETLISALIGTYRTRERQNVDRCAELLRFVGLGGKVESPSTTLSGGELRMLEVARQLVRNPSVLLLDEPTAGVDPDLQRRLADLIREIHAAGTTVVVVEHNLSFLLALAERVVVLTLGRVIAEGSPDEIRANPQVIEAYLGRR